MEVYERTGRTNHARHAAEAKPWVALEWEDGLVQTLNYRPPIPFPTPRPHRREPGTSCAGMTGISRSFQVEAALPAALRTEKRIQAREAHSGQLMMSAANKCRFLKMTIAPGASSKSEPPAGRRIPASIKLRLLASECTSRSKGTRRGNVFRRRPALSDRCRETYPFAVSCENLHRRAPCEYPYPTGL